jgi:hypothetical protein
VERSRHFYTYCTSTSVHTRNAAMPGHSVTSDNFEYLCIDGLTLRRNFKSAKTEKQIIKMEALIQEPVTNNAEEVRTL